MSNNLQVAGLNRNRSGAGHWLAILATMALLLGLLSFLGVGSAEAYAADTSSGAIRPFAQMMATTGHVPFPLVTANEAGDVRFPIAEFADGVAHFYTFMANGLPVEFFVVHTPDNVIRSAYGRVRHLLSRQARVPPGRRGDGVQQLWESIRDPTDRHRPRRV